MKKASIIITIAVRHTKEYENHAYATRDTRFGASSVGKFGSEPTARWWRLSLTCHACWCLSATFVSLRGTSMTARTPTRLHIILGTSLTLYPLRWCNHYHSFSEYFEGIQYTTERRTRLVTTELIVSNCSALLSRDHTETLAHASSRTERRSFDELTRTVNHDYSDGGEGLASSATETAERARVSPNMRGLARARPSSRSPTRETRDPVRTRAGSFT